jgi:hypothetical protein
MSARDGFSGRLSHSNSFPSPRRDDRREIDGAVRRTLRIYIRLPRVTPIELTFHTAKFCLQANKSIPADLRGSLGHILRWNILDSIPTIVFFN